jgi:glycosyltransferase
MKFSIITATFNSSKTLNYAIESLRNQKGVEIEYIVIDGSSTDGTIDIIKQNSDIVSKWKSEPDNGIFDALNKGILLSEGDVIGFLHSDDFFAHNNALLSIKNEFERYKVDGVYSDLQYVKKSNYNKIVRNWISGKYNYINIKKGWMPPHPALFIKSEIYKKYGLFNTEYKIASDYDIMMRFLWKYKISLSYINNPLIKMRTGGKSNILTNISLKMKEDYRIIKTLKIGGLKVLVKKNIRKIPQYFS